MPHSWVAYRLAGRITAMLVEGNHISDKDSLKIRGEIQIIIEDNYEVRKIKGANSE